MSIREGRERGASKCTEPRNVAMETNQESARVRSAVDQGGRDTRRLSDEARDELIRRYMPLARRLAWRYQGRGESLDDLTQVAYLGLVKAGDRFEPRRGVKFSTYATATIAGELKRHFRDRGWTVRVPRRLQENGLRVHRARDELVQELGRSPTPAEIGSRIDLTEDEVLEASLARGAYGTLSLDFTPDAFGDGDRSLLDRIGCEDEGLELVERWSEIAPVLQELPERERRILHLRFFEGRTQEEIGQELGISQMHVSRLLRGVLEEVRRGLGASSA